VNNVTEVMPLGATVGRGVILRRLFVIGYVAAVGVAMTGWVSAFGWLTVRVAKWLLA
jgi:hypothetical protein